MESARFEYLRNGDPVRLFSDACLIVRRPGAECSLCREACPKAVLGGGEWSIALEQDGCTGCGICSAACPTGALAVDGFALPGLVHDSNAVDDASVARIALPIECARVPESARSEGAEIVPCLGGLTVPDLLERAASGGAVVMDRSLCESCEVGCGAAPWNSALRTAREHLARIDVAMRDRLSCQSAPIDATIAQSVNEALRPDLAAKSRIGRRDLLRRVFRPELEESPLARSRRIIDGRGLVAPVRRERELASLEALADQNGTDLPATLMPAIRLAEGCGLHGVCAAICPTGALRLEHTEAKMALTFDAAGCISCGECQRACPTKALSLWPDGDGTLAEVRRILATRASRACDGCGDTFALAAGDTTTRYCPICEKSIGLMQAVSALRRPCVSP